MSLFNLFFTVLGWEIKIALKLQMWFIETMRSRGHFPSHKDAGGVGLVLQDAFFAREYWLIDTLCEEIEEYFKSKTFSKVEVHLINGKIIAECSHANSREFQVFKIEDELWVEATHHHLDFETYHKLTGRTQEDFEELTWWYCPSASKQILTILNKDGIAYQETTGEIRIFDI